MGQVVRESYFLIRSSHSYLSQPPEPPSFPTSLIYYYSCLTALIIDDVQLTSANQVLLAIGVVVLSLAIAICICLIVGETTTNCKNGKIATLVQVK